MVTAAVYFYPSPSQVSVCPKVIAKFGISANAKERRIPICLRLGVPLRNFGCKNSASTIYMHFVFFLLSFLLAVRCHGSKRNLHKRYSVVSGFLLPPYLVQGVLDGWVACSVCFYRHLLFYFLFLSLFFPFSSDE